MRSARVASKDATPTESFHKSRADRVVCMCVRLNRCWCGVCLFCIGNEVYVFASTLCKHDLFVLRWATVRQVLLGLCFSYSWSGSIFVLSCRCWVHPVVIRNAAFCVV